MANNYLANVWETPNSTYVRMCKCALLDPFRQIFTISRTHFAFTFMLDLFVRQLLPASHDFHSPRSSSSYLCINL